MPRSDMKRRHKSTSPPHTTGRSQRGERSPVLSDPRSASPSLSRGEFATLSAPCSPKSERLSSKSFREKAEVQQEEDFNGESARKNTRAEAGEGQAHHDFNYADARSFYKMASLSPAFQPPQPQQPLGPMHALHDALMTGEFSDMAIVCGPETFSVHRIIVCTQSHVLAQLYSETKIPNTLDLSMDDVSAVAKMLEYLYKDDYSVPDVDRPPAYGLFTHIATHALGVKYNIKGLMALAANNFAIALRRVSDLEVYFRSIHEVYSQLASPFTFGSQRVSSPQAADAAQGSNTTAAAASTSRPPTPASSGTGARNEIPTNASPPRDGMDNPEALALRAEVVNAAITELSKILAEPLVMARFHRVSMDVTQFHIDLLATLAAERGWSEVLLEQEQSEVCENADDATESEEGVSVGAAGRATAHAGSSGVNGRGEDGAMNVGKEGEREREGRDGAIRHGAEDDVEGGDEDPDANADNASDSEPDNDNGGSDVMLSRIRCDDCYERGGHAFEIKVVCKGCRRFCRFTASSCL